MELLSKSDYRQALEELFQLKKQRLGQKWTLAALAKKIDLQPSYLTNVTKGRAHLSADQIHAIGSALDLSEVEIDYLVLLMEIEKSNFTQRRKKLQLQIEEMRRAHLTSAQYIPTQELQLSDEDKLYYYLDPNVELLHFYFGLKNKSQKIEDIAKALSVPEEFVDKTIEFLSSRKLIELKHGRWVRGSISQYLPENSLLCKPSQQLLRFKALDRLQKIPKEKKYAFMATVSMNEEARFEIQAAYLEFLEKARKIVQNSEPEEVYNIQFELFPWF